MGNYRLRLSDMIPNAWFYKLKDIGKLRNQNTKKNHHHRSRCHHLASSSSSSSAVLQVSSSSKAAARQPQPHLSRQRRSYYFTRDLLSLDAPSSNDNSYDNNVTTNTRSPDSHHTEPPRKSSKKKRKPSRNINGASDRASPSPRLVSSSFTAGCSCGATLESVWIKPDSTPEQYPNSPINSSSENESLLPGFGSNRVIAPAQTFDGTSCSASCRCNRVDDDIIVDMEKRALNPKFDSNSTGELHRFNTASGLELPPIITNPCKLRNRTEDVEEERETNKQTKFRRSTAKFEERSAYSSLSVKVVKESILNTSSKGQKKMGPAAPTRRFSASSPGLKLRTHSPRIGNKRIQGRKSIASNSSWSSSSRRSVSESFAVVKSSKDPQRDFRESMVEMIVENNICESKDLEDLLACYLSLNSDQYHDLIIRVFKQIWFDVVDIRPS